MHPFGIKSYETFASSQCVNDVYASCREGIHVNTPTGGTFPLTPAPGRGGAGERIPLKISRIEPLNLIEHRSSVVGRSVAALPFGAFGFSGLPAGEVGSGRRHAYCLVTPLGGVPAGEACPSGDDRAHAGWQV